MGSASRSGSADRFMLAHRKRLDKCVAAVVDGDLVRRLNAKIDLLIDDGSIVIMLKWHDDDGRLHKQPLDPISLGVLSAIDKEEFGNDCEIDW